MKPQITTQPREELRKTLLAARRALTAEQVAAWSQRLLEHLLRVFPQPPGKRIAFYAPIQNEPDLRPAAALWREQGATTLLPVVIAPRAPLIFRPWTPDTPLVPDRYGIPTPNEGAEMTPDVVIMTLNAFDARGYRLGYGGGFFDRTLAALQPRPLVLGVGFEMGRVESIQPEAHDQAVDWVLTEAGAWAVGRSGNSQIVGLY
ncbi:5-formyltetrahydrofolate cyclo-ligase [Betaproteobacteria bacterium]|nr:5-formyltetrahydrofolate cyclo-ligase [Betaproteobacteria bacterium]GHU41620.1 5-formyltetrahydrofolate cyclo-ligase [Betaproteobacteria bacterium]